MALVCAALPLGAARAAPPVPADRPLETPHDGYVSSTACRACHPQQYGSWRASYHRTMTQRATPETVAAPADGVPFRVADQEYRVHAVEGELWAEYGPVERPGERQRRRIVLSTGSHHFQLYWFPTGLTRKLGLYPFAWQIAEARWIPLDDLGITPPGARQTTPEGRGRWNRNCNRCHSTGPQPRVQGPELMDTRVVEFGIACEACHGPAAEHVAANRDPTRRYALHLGGAADPTIVHPERLEADRASQVCGQCHAKTGFHSEEDQRVWAWEGPSYRPGDDLFASRRLVTSNLDPELGEAQRFWPDGAIRINGREYNSLLANPCAVAGAMSCQSCHTMHPAADDPRPLSEWADDQLRPGMRGDAACTQCHESYREAEVREGHTHHPDGSVGGECMNCHMPNTSYGLQKATRSHALEHPSVATNLATGRPNACNLCHLDRSLEWTAQALKDWYGSPVPDLSPEEKNTAAGALWALRGDAGLRGLLAWHFGWAPARQAAGTGWTAPYLAQLLADPYAAVRAMAYRSLRSVEGFGDFVYDYRAPVAEQRRGTLRALRRWKQMGPHADLAGREALLMDGSGDLRLEAFNALVRQRDDRPVFLAE